MRTWQVLAKTGRASLLVVGGLLAVDASDALAQGGCTPPPCAADGNCRPNRREWGWYHTHWRAWPGEQVGLIPSAAAGDATGDAEQGLPGIVLPDPAKEDRTGPERTEGEAAPAAADEEVAAPAEEALPPEEPVEAAPAIDPFGRVEPQPPVQPLLVQPAAMGVAMLPPAPHATAPTGYGQDHPNFVQPLPTVSPLGSGVQPALNVEPATAPSLQRDDAPPTLPASLLNAASAQRTSGPRVTAVPGRQVAPLRAVQPVEPLPTVGTAPISLTQPGSVQSAPGTIRPVSWHDPGGIALVNPAAAVDVEPGAEGTQQAIYYEVSDDAAPAAAE